MSANGKTGRVDINVNGSNSYYWSTPNTTPKSSGRKVHDIGVQLDRRYYYYGYMKELMVFGKVITDVQGSLIISRLLSNFDY